MGTFFNRLRGYILGLPSGSQIKDHPKARDLFDRLLAKRGFMAGRADKPLYKLAKETLKYYNCHGKQFLVYMFGELGKDSMAYLGGIDIVATALAGSTYIS